MLNFNFYNPTRIIFGGDTIAKINDYVPTEAKVLGGVSKSMLKQSRLNFDKIEKCE
ncbi:hypothetical protein V5I80_15545 [Acinetobacter radioresistens]|uniref:hypothetical protein n=1 Tax=Acinetobacter radioresistens TaxID=40216 RepID=UPI002FCDDE09